MAASNGSSNNHGNGFANPATNNSTKTMLSRSLSIFAGVMIVLLLLGFVEIETLVSATTSSFGGGVSAWTSTIMQKQTTTGRNGGVADDGAGLFCPINSSYYLDWAQTVPKYEIAGFCSLMPADLSSTYLWNQHLEWILDATLHSLPQQQPQNDADAESDIEDTVEWMSDLLLWLTPQHLRKGYLQRPEHDAWGHVLQHLYQRKQQLETRPLQIVILGGTIVQGVGSCIAPPNLPKSSSSSTTTTTSRRQAKSQPKVPQSQHNCGWTHRLEYFLNHILGGTLDHPMVQVTRWAIPDTTTEFATSIVEHGLWPSPQTPHDGPDVIINAYSAHDMYWPERGVLVDMDDFNYTNHRRRVTEAFLRAALHSRPCSQHPPLVLTLDDYLGHHHPMVMAEMTNARVLQQMADWYQLPFVSYANVVRRWVYADLEEQVFSPNWHTTPQELVNALGVSVVDDEEGDGSRLTNNVHYGLVAHVGVLWTTAFSLLSATVDYCSHEIMRLDEYPFVTKELMDMVAHVPPPELNADLCLSNVSEKWKEEQEKLQQRQARLCNPNDESNANSQHSRSNETNAVDQQQQHRKDLPHCNLAFWPGYFYHNQGKFDNLKSYLKPWMVDAPTGWSMDSSDRGMVATQQGATVRLQVPILDPPSALKRLRLFVIRHVDWTTSALKWDVRIWNVTNPEVEWNQTTYIRAGHQADVTQLAYPVDMDLPMVVTQGFKVDLTFELVEGNNFEIKAMMLCNGQP